MNGRTHNPYLCAIILTHKYGFSYVMPTCTAAAKHCMNRGITLIMLFHINRRHLWLDINNGYNTEKKQGRRLPSLTCIIAQTLCKAY